MGCRVVVDGAGRSARGCAGWTAPRRVVRSRAARMVHGPKDRPRVRFACEILAKSPTLQTSISHTQVYDVTVGEVILGQILLGEARGPIFVSWHVGRRRERLFNTARPEIHTSYMYVLRSIGVHSTVVARAILPSRRHGEIVCSRNLIYGTVAPPTLLGRTTVICMSRVRPWCRARACTSASLSRRTTRRRPPHEAGRRARAWGERADWHVLIVVHIQLGPRQSVAVSAGQRCGRLAGLWPSPWGRADAAFPAVRSCA